MSLALISQVALAHGLRRRTTSRTRVTFDEALEAASKDAGIAPRSVIPAYRIPVYQMTSNGPVRHEESASKPGFLSRLVARVKRVLGAQ